MLDFTVAIPARFASTRLPGKPLLTIGGKPMIRHVAERALAAGARDVVIATDDVRIVEALHMDSVTVCMTSPEHRSGTDRVAECADQLSWPDDRIIVNLQGDEPFAPARSIRQLAELLAESGEPMATLVTEIRDLAEFNNPNAVKVVIDARGRAMYFSRAPVPWPRDIPGTLPVPVWRHIGIYAYRAGFLKQFSALPPTVLECCESLEQLRALENGFGIATAAALAEFPPGVDTQQDLDRANVFWASREE
ncbi:MAG: 3-deoxy-manno-octulosonate cytidylyltransferase [Gammaproteobacteria bacterium]|jgi:3-deoxy-manno-octulosonate cytidylyltransferase (CMP-KDO synthetase)|nr:3-deoxy-manno-octulosonate cytidylyltransferase [Xanthomonadaceae bacterium]